MMGRRVIMDRSSQITAAAIVTRSCRTVDDLWGTCKETIVYHGGGQKKENRIRWKVRFGDQEQAFLEVNHNWALDSVAKHFDSPQYAPFTNELQL